jgi:hypothetical protein
MQIAKKDTVFFVKDCRYAVGHKPGVDKLYDTMQMSKYFKIVLYTFSIEECAEMFSLAIFLLIIFS